MNGCCMKNDGEMLPTRLEFQVIVEALFEIRFAPQQGVADLLPGILMQVFDEKPRVERLPLADIPHQVRLKQPELAEQPLIRLIWNSHSLYIGDGLLGIGCSLPYPGWGAFKEIISKVIGLGFLRQIIPSPKRFSLKYVDFLPDSKFSGIDKKLNWDVVVAGESIVDSPISFRSEKTFNDYVCLFEVHSPAQVNINGVDILKSDYGLILSFDLIKNIDENLGWENFLNIFSQNLEFLHDEGKRKFFNCLSPEVNKILNPSYD